MKEITVQDPACGTAIEGLTKDWRLIRSFRGIKINDRISYYAGAVNAYSLIQKAAIPHK